MINKLLKNSCAIIVVVLLFAFSLSVALAAESFVLKPLKPQLSRDGKKMYYGIPAVIYRLDPNPSAQRMRIPPPSFLRTPMQKASAAFAITYIPNGGSSIFGYPCTTFPEAAKTAFNAAAAVWAGSLTSPVPITISACWSDDLPWGVLGGSGGGTLHINESGLPTNIWHGASLANALHGSDLDTDNSDMHIIYNSTMDWYYGTDGNPGASQVDLMSVVLHEIAHGLNFSGSMTVSSGSGSWGYSSGYPNIYDTFMYDAATAGNQLINTTPYPNPSAALGTALTSESVWFYGPEAVIANSGRVKMYAPSPWEQGSSYSHLDYDTFNGTINTLMVYAISAGEYIHDPGPIVLAMFKDMGWPDKSATTADVGVAISDSPDPLVIGNNLTYTITVTNNDLANTAEGVIMSDNLPASVILVSVTPGTGSCTGTGTVACSLGSIAAGGNVTILMVVTPTSAAATLNNTVTVSSTSTDGTPANDSATASTTLSNPTNPAISSLSPASATASPSAWGTLIVTGSDFSGDSIVYWNGAARDTTFVSFTQLTAPIEAGDIATAGSYPVTVVNPAPGGGTSGAATFTVNAASSPSVPLVAGEGGSGNMCFIATAAFGSPLERHVQILRDFRDRHLLRNSAGKAFVKFYYEVSPPIAKIIAQSNVLRLLTRASLLPIVGVAYLIMNFGPLSALLMMLAMLAALSAIIWMTRKKLILARKEQSV